MGPVIEALLAAIGAACAGLLLVGCASLLSCWREYLRRRFWGGD